MGGHDQVASSGFHLRAGCPGQIRHDSEPISGTNPPPAAALISGTRSSAKHCSPAWPDDVTRDKPAGSASQYDRGSPNVASGQRAAPPFWAGWRPATAGRCLVPKDRYECPCDREPTPAIALEST